MIVLDLLPLEGALNDFIGNRRSSFRYDFEFTDIVKTTKNVEAFTRNLGATSGVSFLTSGFGSLDTNILNFVNIIIGDDYTNNFYRITIYNSTNILYTSSLSTQDPTTQTANKNIYTENPSESFVFVRNVYYSEVFTEEALRVLKEHIITHLFMRFLDLLNAYSLVPAVVVSTNIYSPYHPNLGATNIKDVMHWVESYYHTLLQDENDRIVFLLDPRDFQRLVRLKDSTGNYVFCSNCMWDNKFELGKSIIINFVKPSYQFNFLPNHFYVFVKSKAYFVVFSPLSLRIVRAPLDNRYHFELSMRCLFIYPPVSTIPFSNTFLASNLLVIDWNSLLNNV